MKTWIRAEGRGKRHLKIRKTLVGTKERPRLSIYRSLTNIYAQLIDDDSGKTIVSLSTLTPEIKAKIKNDSGNVKGASALGQGLADACKKSGIEKVVFDRSGYKYHGRIKAVAEAARKNGLIF